MPDDPPVLPDRAFPGWGRWAVPLVALLGVAVVDLGRKAMDAWNACAVQWGQDLAFFHQIFHAAAEGRAWTSSLLLEPTGFFEMVHFHPIFALVLPIFLVRPEATTLLLVNVLAVVAGAWPLAALARDRTGSRAFGVAAALAFLLWLPVQTAALADFEPMCFFVPGFLVLLHGVYRRSWARIVVGLALCFLAREESSYLVAGLGASLVLLPFGGWRRRQGAVVLAAALAWFATLLLVKGNFFFHFNPLHLFGGGEGGTAPDPALTADRWRHLGFLALGGFGTVVLSPAALAGCLGPLGYLFSVPGKEWQLFTGPYAFYRDVLIPFLGAGGVMGWGLLVDRFPRRRTLALGLAATAMVAGNALAFLHARARLSEGVWARNRAAASSEEVLALRALVDRVDPEARVATDYALIAWLSGRRVLWNVNHLYLEDGRPPWWTVEWPLTLDRVDTVVLREDDPFVTHLDDAWALDGRAAGYGMWKRTREPAGGYPEPLP